MLEDMVKDKEWDKVGTGRGWVRDTDMVVGNKKTIGPSYRTESSGHCCNQLALPCYSQQRYFGMTVAPLDSGAA